MFQIAADRTRMQRVGSWKNQIVYISLRTT